MADMFSAYPIPSNVVFNKEFAKLFWPLKPTITSQDKINIYAGTGENAELSNFAVRPTTYNTAYVKGLFMTPEGAYQASKIASTEDATSEEKKHNAIVFEKLKTASGKQAKALGRTIKGLNTVEWDSQSSDAMYDLLLDSFKQNPEALAKLLATGNATLTHTQDKGKWGTEFPKLLMQVRDELKPTTTSQVDNVANAKTQEKADILHAIDPNVLPSRELMVEAIAAVYRKEGMNPVNAAVKLNKMTNEQIAEEYNLKCK